MWQEGTQGHCVSGGMNVWIDNNIKPTATTTVSDKSTRTTVESSCLMCAFDYDEEEDDDEDHSKMTFLLKLSLPHKLLSKAACK